MLKLKAFWIVYVSMSFIKLFTAKVGSFADPTERLVLKFYPTIGNTFNIYGEDYIKALTRYAGTWYFEGRYLSLLADEHGFAGEEIYYLIITLWWVLTFFIMLALLYRLIIKRIRNY